MFSPAFWIVFGPYAPGPQGAASRTRKFSTLEHHGLPWTVQNPLQVLVRKGVEFKSSHPHQDSNGFRQSVGQLRQRCLP